MSVPPNDPSQSPQQAPQSATSAPPPMTGNPAAAAVSPKNGIGTAALVIGILALIGAFIPGLGVASIPLGLLGLVLAIVAMSRVSKRVATNRGSAIAGLILNILAVITAIIVLAVTAAFVGAVNDSLNEGGAAPATSAGSAGGGQSQAAEQRFPGQTAEDVVVDAGGSAKLGDVVVTSSALTPASTSIGEYLCTSVTYTNEGSDQGNYSSTDWTLQTPAGAIVNATITGRDKELSTGQLAPGGKASGEVCFDATDESGTHVVLAKSLFSFTGGRAAWINEV